MRALNQTTFFCAPCNRAFDEGETKAVRAGTGFVRVCPNCGTLTQKQTSEIAARASRPLAVEMMLAYAFPFRPASLMALGPMALLVALACWSVHGILLGVICYGLMIAMIFAIVRATASPLARIGRHREGALESGHLALRVCDRRAHLRHPLARRNVSGAAY